ncbi:MAG: sigma-54-dependent Fis family transcriptional regulator [Spirochaetaceae bacterium]|nr:sigma-54-dependent Fis family transcriptional regulator [Spirochaetaceae bacterium]
MNLIFIGNDKKCFNILKMSITNIKISLLSSKRVPLYSLKKGSADIILIDLDFIERDLLLFISEVQALNDFSAVYLTGKNCPISILVQAVKMGVTDFIPKPFNSESLYKIENAVNFTIKESVKRMKYHVDLSRDISGHIIGCSKGIQIVKERIQLYAAANAAVLLLGESGVGKNLIARCIHNLSNRKKYAYHTMHTAALTQSIIESELYGTTEGAFTDAKSRPGYFESANNGTLFLDEIGEMPMESQVKLLRILEEKTITRVGGFKQIPIDVRVISATNIHLNDAVKNKLFREDLYYRINTLSISIPPLRERMEDVPLLVESFLNNNELNYTISKSGLEKLIQHSWPGNVRELKSVLTRAGIHSGAKRKINYNHIIFN